MHAHELDGGQELERGNRLGRRTRCDGETELGVFATGADELVRMGLDAGGDADEDGRPVRTTRRRIEQATQAGDLVEGVDHNASHSILEGGGQLLLRLVVAVEDQLVGGHAGGEGDVQLAPGRHIEVHALFIGQPGHGAAEERLSGVGDSLPPGRDGGPAGLTQVVLVVDEQRCAELGSQVE